MGEIRDAILIDPRVTQQQRPQLNRGVMNRVNGIIIHQTHNYSAADTLRAYQNQIYGAHFLIDRGGGNYRGDDEKFYQTMRVDRQCAHVGRIRQRCVAEGTCELSGGTPAQINRTESRRSYPQRFPTNADSIGIELVGRGEGRLNEEVYAAPSSAQISSTIWLLEQILTALPHIGLVDIFAHPEVSYKRPTEGMGFWSVVIESDLPILNQRISSRRIGNVEIRR